MDTLAQAVDKVSLQEFLPELEFEYTDAPQDLLSAMVLRAIQRLCLGANVLRRTTRVHLHPPATHYKLKPIDDTKLIAVMAICVEQGLCCCTRQLIRVNGPTCSCSCCGQQFAHVDGDELVVERPQPCEVLRVELSVQPGLDACEVDRVLLDEHYQTIVTGVRAIMCAMVDKPWSSWERSRQAETLFRQGIAEAAVWTLTGRQRGAFRASIPRAF